MASSTRSHAERIAGGLAAFLAAAGVVQWDDFDEDPYDPLDPPEWPTFLGPEMPATPDRCVVLTPTTRSYVRADVMQGVQIRVRGSVDGVSAEVLDKLQEIHDVIYPNGFPLSNATLGDVRVGAVLPAGDELPLDPDAGRRRGIIKNVRVRARRPRPE